MRIFTSSFIGELDPSKLASRVVGIDRGVVRPVQAGDKTFDLTAEQKRKKLGKEKYLKRMQRRLAGQKKGSRRRQRSKNRIARVHEKLANIRKDFCHQTSRSIVDSAEVIILEDLGTHRMTKRAKVKQDPVSGKWLGNGARAKSGLNRAILNIGWHILESYLAYKAYRSNKALFKVSPHHTSQECAACGHIHPSNRQSQSKFECLRCHHRDHADRNAACVIAKRAITLIQDSGTELSSRGVLLPGGSGRGAASKTRAPKGARARSKEASKKKACAGKLEANPL